MSEFTVAKTVEELEKRYNVKRGDAERFPINKENMPEQFPSPQGLRFGTLRGLALN